MNWRIVLLIIALCIILVLSGCRVIGELGSFEVLHTQCLDIWVEPNREETLPLLPDPHNERWLLFPNLVLRHESAYASEWWEFEFPAYLLDYIYPVDHSQVALLAFSFSYDHKHGCGSG